MFWNISKRDNFEIFQKSVGCTRNFRVQEEIPKGEAQIHQPNKLTKSGPTINIFNSYFTNTKIPLSRRLFRRVNFNCRFSPQASCVLLQKA